MKLLRKNKALLVLLLFACGFMARAQNNGMYYDHRNTYFIPMQQHDELVGHAYVTKVDALSRDSNAYIIGVYDQYLGNVGEKRINMAASLDFDCAAFDGKYIYTRFIHARKGVSYLVFDQNAELVFDTTLELSCKKSVPNDVAYYQRSTIFPLDGEGIIDNLFLTGGSAPASATIRISPDHTVWINENISGKGCTNQILYADNSIVVEGIYHYTGRRSGRRVKQTDIVTLNTATGISAGTGTLTGTNVRDIYPVNASVDKGTVEIISQYTYQKSKHARIRYGACIHRMNMNGQIVDSKFNDLTKTLIRDSVIKDRTLMVNSYLYMSHAAHLDNGHWIIVMQQFSRVADKVTMFRNKYASCDVKSVCFIELDKDAKMLARHLEPNKVNRVRMPASYYSNPEHGGIYLQTSSIADVSYFVSRNTSNDQVSFVYADVDDHRNLVIGNVLFRNGEFSVDKFSKSSLAFTAVGLIPARFGHTYLVRFNSMTGVFDFDNIKFNN